MIAPADNDSFPISIAADSERQAMDWSLVLTSQGMESTLVRSEENGQWLLVVEARDQHQALASIRQYQLENRGWGWRRELPWSGIFFHWGVLGWCVGIILFHVLANSRGRILYAAGQMDSAAVLAGQWWRLFTAVTLHADAGHLAANATTGFLLLGLAMARFGPGWALLSAYLAGVSGNLGGLLLYSASHRSLGVSGMVMGALGLVAAHSFSLWRQSPRATRIALSGIFTGVLLFILLGLNPESDVVAHLGGFVAGAVFGAVLAYVPITKLHKVRSNSITVLCLAILVIATWWLALSH